MVTATVKLEFDAAKRLLDFEGKCNFLHGYRYVMEVTISAKKLDKAGLVVDFYKVKEVLDVWVQENWDHNVVLDKRDKNLGQAIAKITGQKIYYMSKNPSAENMAEHLIKEIFPKLMKKFPGVICSKIRLYDNPNAWVEVSLRG